MKIQIKSELTFFATEVAFKEIYSCLSGLGSQEKLFSTEIIK